MESFPLLPVAAGAALLLLVLLALKLRGPRGRDDLLGPAGRRRKRITPKDAARLLELVSSGDEAAALRTIREAGYDEAAARKILGLVHRFDGHGMPQDRDAGW